MVSVFLLKDINILHVVAALTLGQDRQKIQELDRQIAATQARILEQRQKMGGLNASQENNEMIAKQIRTLENRLDKVRVISLYFTGKMRHCYLTV